MSIITPFYNVEKYLNDYFSCIDDINLKDIQFIFINDGSTDSTKSKIVNYIDEHKGKNIIFIDQKNIGIGLTRNKAINYIEGEYFLFFDSDDFIKVNSLNLICDILKKEKPDAFCLKSKNVKEKSCYKRKQLKNIKYKIYDFHSKKNVLENALALKEIKVGSAYLIGKSAIIKEMHCKNDAFKDIIGEDTDFELKFLNKSEKILVSQQQYYFYRKRRNSLMHESFKEKYISVVDCMNCMLNNSIPDEIKQYALMRKCLNSIDVMVKMIKAKYCEKNKIRYVYNSFANNLKYVRKCKLLPWYMRYFTCLTKPYFYIKLRSYLK